MRSDGVGERYNIMKYITRVYMPENIPTEDQMTKVE